MSLRAKFHLRIPWGLTRQVADKRGTKKEKNETRQQTVEVVTDGRSVEKLEKRPIFDDPKRVLRVFASIGGTIESLR